jgi:hypothetical protein
VALILWLRLELWRARLRLGLERLLTVAVLRRTAPTPTPATAPTTATPTAAAGLAVLLISLRARRRLGRGQGGAGRRLDRVHQVITLHIIGRGRLAQHLPGRERLHRRGLDIP